MIPRTFCVERAANLLQQLHIVVPLARRSQKTSGNFQQQPIVIVPNARTARQIQRDFEKQIVIGVHWS